MSVQRRPSGAWRARYRDTQGREHAQHFPTRKEAEDWLAGQRVSMRRGEWVDPRAGKITFGAYARGWMASQTRWRPTTRRAAWIRLRRILATFDDVPIGRIKPSDVVAWLAALDVAAGTASSTCGFFVRILEDAVRDRVVAVNPARGVRRPRAEPRSDRVLQGEEVEALAAAMPAHLQALVTFSADTGLRQAEALGLTVDRVDFLRRTVRVDRQLVDARYAPLKTPAAARLVPLADETVELLAAHLAAFPPLSSGLIFTTTAGSALWASALTRAWSTARRSVGLEWVRWHDLRHYCASVLIDSGCPVKVVQRTLGHASAKVTLDVYAHLFDAADDRVRDAVSARRKNADDSRTRPGKRAAWSPDGRV